MFFSRHDKQTEPTVAPHLHILILIMSFGDSIQYLYNFVGILLKIIYKLKDFMR
jgi:hypothetical protein